MPFQFGASAMYDNAVALYDYIVSLYDISRNVSMIVGAQMRAGRAALTGPLTIWLSDQGSAHGQ